MYDCVLMIFVLIQNKTNPTAEPIRARYCSTFLCRLRGLMFTPSIGEREGLLMVQTRADRIDSSIHMLFMAYDLAVIWLDSHYRVVDVKYCQRWKLAYVPAAPARYILETHVDRVKDFHMGDQITIQP